MADSFGKKEKEKKKAKKREEKAKRKAERKQASEEGGGGVPMAWVDEFGNILDSPPDPTAKKEVIKAEDIELGIPKKEEVEEETVREGTVSFFNHDKGFGFIKIKNSHESIFVHVNGCTESIDEGNRVQFETEPGQKGPVAVKVSIVR
jgi:cold shock CspA family protein